MDIFSVIIFNLYVTLVLSNINGIVFYLKTGIEVRDSFLYSGVIFTVFNLVFLPIIILDQLGSLYLILIAGLLLIFTLTSAIYLKIDHYNKVLELKGRSILGFIIIYKPLLAKILFFPFINIFNILLVIMFIISSFQDGELWR